MARTLRTVAIACAALGVTGAPSALADELQMSFRTWNGDGSGRVGQQMKLLVTPHMDAAQNMYADFTFTNNVGVRSSVMDLVFRQAQGHQVLSGRGQILYQMGSTFTTGQVGELPPGGRGLNYSDVGYTTGAGDRSQGLDAAWDSVTVRFELRYGRSFADLFQAIHDENLLLGARAETDVDSLEWYAARAFRMVPMPQAAPLAVVGLGLLGLRRRRH